MTRQSIAQNKGTEEETRATECRNKKTRPWEKKSGQLGGDRNLKQRNGVVDKHKRLKKVSVSPE